MKECKEFSKNLSSESVEYPEPERLHMFSKNDFNSIYGMRAQKSIPKENGNHITIYATSNLLNAIIKNCSDSFCYCDTDSVFYNLIGGDLS